MKRSITLLLLLVAASVTFAQQRSKARHMTITIINDNVAFTIGHKPNNMFITRDDTAQVQRKVDLDMHVKLRDRRAAYEQLMMDILKPWYNEGWQLTSTSMEVIPSAVLPTEIFRYYFIKEE